jgi:hypothetical protein
MKSPAILSGCMGKTGKFDKAIAAISIASAGQNEKDHNALKEAVDNGKIDALFKEGK